MVKYKTETFRSAVVKKNLNPVWDFTCRIGDTDDCTQGGMVTIAVWDSDMGRDEKIGEISVQIAAMQTSSEPVQLQLAGKKAKDSKIFVTYTVNEAADASVGAAGGAATADGGGETKGTDRETKDLDSDEERRGLDPNMLIVDIIKAEGLKAADRGGVSDPQVTLYCGGKKYVSKEIKNTINPTWGERCRFPVTMESSAKEKKLRIQIDDLDVAMHDLLGSCEVDLESLEHHTVIARTLNLFDVKYNKITPNAKAALGKLYIRLEWTHDADEATTTSGKIDAYDHRSGKHRVVSTDRTCWYDLMENPITDHGVKLVLLSSGLVKEASDKRSLLVKCPIYQLFYHQQWFKKAITECSMSVIPEPPIQHKNKKKYTRKGKVKW